MRDAMQENMKQAFMRGVCALNIEAMAVMKHPDQVRVSHIHPIHVYLLVPVLAKDS
jgi:hypothetical protein